jgi:hypothetical protein
MYLCVSGIDFAFLYDFSIAFWNCSDIVVFYQGPRSPFENAKTAGLEIAPKLIPEILKIDFAL